MRNFFRLVIFISLSLYDKFKSFVGLHYFRAQRSHPVAIVINGYNLTMRNNAYGCEGVQHLLQVFSRPSHQLPIILQPFSFKPRGRIEFEIERIEKYLSTTEFCWKAMQSIKRVGLSKTKLSIFSILEFELWCKYLVQSKLKLLFAIYPSEALKTACCALKIKLYDVQHGLFPVELMDSSDQYLKSRYNSNQIVWSNHESEFFARIGHHALVLGHPKPEVKSKAQRDLMISVSLTYDHPFPSDSKGLFGKEMESAIEELIQENCLLFVFFHPMCLMPVNIGERRKQFSYFKEYILDKFSSSNIHAIHPNRLAFKDAISRSRVLVTEPGTSIIDAALRGVPSLVVGNSISPPLQFDSLERLGYLQIAKRGDLLRQVQEMQSITVSPLQMNGLEKDIQSINSELDFFLT